MAAVDELTRRLGALNTVLAYYKYTDDIADGDRGRGKRLWFKKGFRLAKKKYPEIEKIVRENLKKQDEVEKSGADSLDRAADATANMLAEFSVYALGEKSTEHTKNCMQERATPFVRGEYWSTMRICTANRTAHTSTSISPLLILPKKLVENENFL